MIQPTFRPEKEAPVQRRWFRCVAHRWRLDRKQLQRRWTTVWTSHRQSWQGSRRKVARRLNQRPSQSSSWPLSQIPLPQTPPKWHYGAKQANAISNIKNMSVGCFDPIHIEDMMLGICTVWTCGRIDTEHCQDPWYVDTQCWAGLSYQICIKNNAVRIDAFNLCKFLMILKHLLILVHTPYTFKSQDSSWIATSAWTS